MLCIRVSAWVLPPLAANYGLTNRFYLRSSSGWFANTVQKDYVIPGKNFIVTPLPSAMERYYNVGLHFAMVDIPNKSQLKDWEQKDVEYPPAQNRLKAIYYIEGERQFLLMWKGPQLARLQRARCSRYVPQSRMPYFGTLTRHQFMVCACTGDIAGFLRLFDDLVVLCVSVQMYMYGFSSRTRFERDNWNSPYRTAISRCFSRSDSVPCIQFFPYQLLQEVEGESDNITVILL